MSQPPNTPETKPPLAPRRAPTAPSVYFLAVAVLLVLFLLFVAAPLLQWWAQSAPQEGRIDSRLPLSMIFQYGAMNGFTLVWFFAVGASFGSFMNVVSWRVPRRMNFVSQSSICPNCRHAIRGRDNLPILGWILLGGKCRDCGEPISFRYPLVEIFFGGAAFFLCAWELASGGQNLPFYSGAFRGGFFETLWTPKWDLIIVLAFHFALYVWLLTICLFEIDDEATPRGFAIFALLMALAITYACPIVQPVSWQLSETALARPSPLAPERFSGLIGLCAGAFAALPAALLARTHAINYLLAGALVGAYLGWHAAISAMAIAQMASLLYAKLAGRQEAAFSRTAILVAAVTIQIAAWRWLHAAQWQFGAVATTLWLVIAAIAIFILPALPSQYPRRAGA